jgi:hypothetical protein
VCVNSLVADREDGNTDDPEYKKQRKLEKGVWMKRGDL